MKLSFFGKILVFFSILFLAYLNTKGTISIHTIIAKATDGAPVVPPVAAKKSVSVYDSLRLGARGLSRHAYDYAMKGLLALDEKGVVKNDSIITIVDFNQPSYNKRMYILDLKNYKILFHTWAAHGKNTGRESAKSFSNLPNSHKSSLGFYVTDIPYNGGNGYSLKLVGLEKSNCNAIKRAIVLHGAPYVSQKTIETTGFIGRSHGCPAVPMELTAPIINLIKGGSCLFIYSKSYNTSLNI